MSNSQGNQTSSPAPFSFPLFLPTLFPFLPSFFPPFFFPALAPSLASEGVNGQALPQDNSQEKLPARVVLSGNRVILSVSVLLHESRSAVWRFCCFV